jgi:cobalt/nickel transport system permease protein
MNMPTKLRLVTLFLAILVWPVRLSAMHIAEGFLSPQWCGIWFLLALPFVIYGLRTISKTKNHDLNTRLMWGIAGGFLFVLSAFKLPSVTGSSSHLTGIALGTVIIGVGPMILAGGVVLLFQALLLAHGGLTTLGANMVSLSIVGSLSTMMFYKLLQYFRLRKKLIFFSVAFFSSLCVYCFTSIQLALAFPDGEGLEGIWVSFFKFASLFGITQIPLAVVEGFITMFAISYIYKVIPQLQRHS